MKKVLIGLAAGALAFTATASSVSAAFENDPTRDSIYEVIQEFSEVGTDLVDSAGLDKALDTCENGKPQYTLFFPSLFMDSVWANPVYEGPDGLPGEAFLDAIGLTYGQLLAQPALIKALLLYHVIPSEVLPGAMEVPSNTKFASMGGLTLLKTVNAATGDVYINGLGIDDFFGACNGHVYLINGVLAPNNDVATIGLTNDGSTTQSSPPAAGLPATGSESMALTYAALASLIAGAGVLVIRRRSVA